MEKIFFTVLFYTLVLTLYSCTNTEHSNSKTVDHKMSAQPDPLPDSLFPFQNISSSLLVNSFKWDSDGNCYYQDSVKKIRFIALDSSQKRKYISSIGILSPEWIMNDWQVDFVARQDRIGQFRPVVVWAGGTDYGALILILLDGGLHPVSYFVLNGGECGDVPAYCDLKHSFLDKDVIRSYVVKRVWKKSSYSGYVDSINYLTKIFPDGHLVTTRIDSARYKSAISEE